MTINNLLEILNNNQGVIAVIVFLLGIVGFAIKKVFFSNTENKLAQKQRAGDNSTNLQAGRDINYGDK